MPPSHVQTVRFDSVPQYLFKLCTWLINTYMRHTIYCHIPGFLQQNFPDWWMTKRGLGPSLPNNTRAQHQGRPKKHFICSCHLWKLAKQLGDPLSSDKLQWTQRDSSHINLHRKKINSSRRYAGWISQVWRAFTMKQTNVNWFVIRSIDSNMYSECMMSYSFLCKRYHVIWNSLELADNREITDELTYQSKRKLKRKRILYSSRKSGFLCKETWR